MWVFSKTDTTITISCNGVVLVTHTLEDISGTMCGVWIGDIVDSIEFMSHDTASTTYSDTMAGFVGKKKLKQVSTAHRDLGRDNFNLNLIRIIK